MSFNISSLISFITLLNQSKMRHKSKDLEAVIVTEWAKYLISILNAIKLKKKINELINYIEKSWDQKYKAVTSRVLATFLCLLATQFLQFPGNNFTF